MIRALTLNDVGPTRDLQFSFSPRLNVLTGDNGLGKTFVLDVLWWVLTTTWAGDKAFPFRPLEGEEGARFDQGAGGSGRAGEAGPPGSKISPNIWAVLSHRNWESGVEQGVETGGRWQWDMQDWLRYSPGRPPQDTLPIQVRHLLDESTDRPSSLVVYARVDGSYAVFDAHYTQGGIASYADAAIILSPSELWDGKEVSDPLVQGGRRTVINGLIADWVSWMQRAKSPEFDALCHVLETLSPPGEPMRSAEPIRVHLRDRRDIPTVQTAYGLVPVSHASAGMKRALSLAYLLVWAWFEHERAAKVSRRERTRDVILLIDEPELHLHPKWQRAFLPAVLKAVSTVAPNAGVQVFTTTHSPLVMASLEHSFDPSLDSLFDLDLSPDLGGTRQVQVHNLPWRRQGDVSKWLTSEVFNLGYARSLEAEQALQQAVRALQDPDLSEEATREIHHALQGALGDTDPFWARWLAYAETKGIAP